MALVMTVMPDMSRSAWARISRHLAAVDQNYIAGLDEAAGGLRDTQLTQGQFFFEVLSYIGQHYVDAQGCRRMRAWRR